MGEVTVVRLAVVVPTYWGPVREYELGKPSPAYDHPTPMDSQGTMPQLLDSLAALDDRDFPIFLIVGATSPELERAAEEKVLGIARAFRGKLDISVVGKEALTRLRTQCKEAGLDPEAISPWGYGNIRNLGLIAGLLSGAEAIVLLDDDEVVGPGYLARARKAVESSPGVGGPYLNAQGSPFLPEEPARGNPFLDKACHINAALRELLADRMRKPTPLAFGGNMVLRRELARAVPFDPLIPRGEDIDYVLSSWLFGFEFHFNPELSVTHLPPAGPRPSPCEALRRDVVRFLYQREKLAAASRQGLTLPLDPAPYPGHFFNVDLEKEALRALQSSCRWSYRKTKTFLGDVSLWLTRSASFYFEFIKKWRSSIPRFLKWEPPSGSR